jgi:type II secretory pathway component PulC
VNQNSLIKGLAVVLGLALVALIGYSIFKVYYTTPSQQVDVTGTSATLDENLALKETIDSLEALWSRRQDYVFRVSQDPLHLGRVIKDFRYERTGNSESDEDRVLRLSATVIDENPKAIIKYRGKSYVVQTGDVIENRYKVLEIEKMQVILENNGKRVALVAKPVSELESSPEGSVYSNNAGDETYNY